ncbi:hypothetical protein RJ639_035407 [Escallonia herrerae]|uniref:FAR1 domain-containing protein n=1 Tax=Escallonia herrerae TaxID=1293975 RepID=A0AA89BHU0_9ASTE|nr:hypothetical protein RJ639_035407 [Escallonia herrerae]
MESSNNKGKEAAANYIDDDISTFVHRVDDNFEFKLVMMFNSEDEAFNTYNAYARNKGFGVRKGQKYIHGKSQELRRCTFLCSCEGHAPYVPPHEERKVERIETRCGCGSYIKFKISTGLWEVIEFNPIHNHPFVPEHQRHLIRSHRRLTEGVKGVLDSFKSVGVGATKSFGFIANDTGGIRNVGCTLRDAQNYLQSERNNATAQEASHSYNAEVHRGPKASHALRHLVIKQLLHPHNCKDITEPTKHVLR